MRDEDSVDPLDTESDDAPAPKKTKKVKKAADPKKPSKAKVTKPAAEAAPAKAKKGAAKAAPAKATKKAKSGDEDAKPRGRPRTVPEDVSTQQPEDNVVLKAVRKLKDRTLAAEFAATLGVHRRVIRAQLQRLSKDKANGVSMKKDGYNWYVANNQKA